MMLVATLRAFASRPRLQILGWLKQPRAHFREQIDGDLVEDGVCGLLIAEKLGVSQPTVTEHMKLLVEIGAVRAKRIKHGLRRDVGQHERALTVGPLQIYKRLIVVT